MRSLTSGSDSYQVYPASDKLRFYGFNAYNNSALPVTISVHNGVSNIDPLLASLTLQPHTSGNVWLEGAGEAAPNGLYVSRDAKTELAVYFNA